MRPSLSKSAKRLVPVFFLTFGSPPAQACNLGLTALEYLACGGWGCTWYNPIGWPIGFTRSVLSYRHRREPPSRVCPPPFTRLSVITAPYLPDFFQKLLKGFP